MTWEPEEGIQKGAAEVIYNYRNEASERTQVYDGGHVAYCLFALETLHEANGIILFPFKESIQVQVGSKHFYARLVAI